MRLIDADALENEGIQFETYGGATFIALGSVRSTPTIDPESLRPKGEWILEAHDERVNFRWHVTAKCSECEAEPKEIWAGFFPCISDEVASFIALESAESVKLDNFCPNCGAKMDGDRNG